MPHTGSSSPVDPALVPHLRVPLILTWTDDDGSHRARLDRDLDGGTCPDCGWWTRDLFVPVLLPVASGLFGSSDPSCLACLLGGPYPTSVSVGV